LRSAAVPISFKHSYGVFEKGDPGSLFQAAGPYSYTYKVKVEGPQQGDRLDAGAAHCARDGPWGDGARKGRAMDPSIVNADARGRVPMMHERAPQSVECGCI
jgi:hypothetical protein